MRKNVPYCEKTLSAQDITYCNKTSITLPRQVVLQLNHHYYFTTHHTATKTQCIAVYKIVLPAKHVRLSGDYPQAAIFVYLQSKANAYIYTTSIFTINRKQPLANNYVIFKYLFQVGYLTKSAILTNGCFPCFFAVCSDLGKQ